jgi:hypothetical protein
MRVFKVAREPTEAELRAVNGEAFDAEIIAETGYYVVVPEDTVIPTWLEQGDVVNIPGEPHRCTNCGEPI